MRPSTPVRELMSKLPAETDRRERLSDVIQKMREHDCHHIPILDGARIFGILSSQDMHELALRLGENTEDLLAGDVCTRDPLTVEPMTPVKDVAQSMLDRGCGSALVTEGDLLIGIFTSTDAMRVIADA